MAISRISDPEQVHLEYHGSTIVVRIRMVSGAIPRREWLLFDTVAEAAEFYNENRVAA